MSFFHCGCWDDGSPPWHKGVCPGNLLVSGGDKTNNYWYREGVGLLDTMTRDFDGCWELQDVIYAIERNEQAREDLKRITLCLTLKSLADNIARLPTSNEGDALSRQLNSVDIIPFYTVKRGRGQDG